MKLREVRQSAENALYAGRLGLAVVKSGVHVARAAFRAREARRSELSVVGTALGSDLDSLGASVDCARLEGETDAEFRGRLRAVFLAR